MSKRLLSWDASKVHSACCRSTAGCASPAGTTLARPPSRLHADAMPPLPFASGIGGATGAGTAGFGSTQTSAADDDGEAAVAEDDVDGTTPLSDEAAVRLPQPAAISDKAAITATPVSYTHLRAHETG